MRLRVAMPVHPHFRDFAVFRLAEHRSAGVHPVARAAAAIGAAELGGEPGPRLVQLSRPERDLQDRKSTRLNSSHSQISYAVFCLKKKKKKLQNTGCPHATKSCAHDLPLTVRQ